MRIPAEPVHEGEPLVEASEPVEQGEGMLDDDVGGASGAEVETRRENDRGTPGVIAPLPVDELGALRPLRTTAEPRASLCGREVDPVAVVLVCDDATGGGVYEQTRIEHRLRGHLEQPVLVGEDENVAVSPGLDHRRDEGHALALNW